jgi:Tol biopolymer transport system component
MTNRSVAHLAARAAALAIAAILILAAHAAGVRPTQAVGPAPAIIRLTTDPAIDVRPSWSPDNKQIAFQSNRNSSKFHIYLMNADGSNQRALTNGANDDRHPVWMPDGKSIIFDSDDDTYEEIWMVGVADGKLTQLTHHGLQANFAVPSPDGKRMAYYLYDNQVLDLWTSNIDGSQPVAVTHQLHSTANNQCTFACHQAAWASDSQSLAYTGGDQATIWMMRADGSGARQVVANEEHNHFPWFLSDGRLAYITEHVSPIQSFTDAWALNLQSGKADLLHDQMSPQGPFEWNNDSTKVLFHSPRAGNFDIYLVDLLAPGGVDALKGKDASFTQADPAATAAAPAVEPAAVAAPASTPAPAEARSQAGLLPYAGAGVLVLLMIVGFALFVVFRNREIDI